MGTDSGAAVDVSSVVEQQLNDVAMSPLAGHVQRSHTVLAPTTTQPHDATDYSYAQKLK